jgi:hypothetical protein
MASDIGARTGRDNPGTPGLSCSVWRQVTREDLSMDRLLLFGFLLLMEICVALPQTCLRTPTQGKYYTAQPPAVTYSHATNP